MKQHLVKLLLEEYKQTCLFNDLAKMGLEIRYAGVDLYNIIFDMIGFPLAEDYNRDPLFDKYNAVFNNPAISHKVIGTEKGLVFVSNEDRLEAEIMTDVFVDWLYEEVVHLPADFY